MKDWIFSFPLFELLSSFVVITAVLGLVSSVMSFFGSDIAWPFFTYGVGVIAILLVLGGISRARSEMRQINHLNKLKSLCQRVSTSMDTNQELLFSLSEVHDNSHSFVFSEDAAAALAELKVLLFDQNRNHVYCLRNEGETSLLSFGFTDSPDYLPWLRGPNK